MSNDDILEGIDLQVTGKMSPRDARTVRLRLRKRIKINSGELNQLIECLTKLRDEIASVASIEFFIEDVE